jgi:hypothetical protein
MRLKQFVTHRLWLPRRTRLRWSRDLSEADFRRRLAEAKEVGGGEAVQDLLHERSAADYFEYEESEIDFTKALVARARDLRVPIPEYPASREENEGWSYSYSFGERYLTAKGIVETREAIRKEERWQHERRAHWIAWLAATTGVIGALIGLVAIFARL